MFDALLGVSAPAIDESLAALKRLIIEKTEGTPLFMEEIVQSLIEEGALVRNGAVKLTRSLDTLKIPPTVEGILASRIDRLPAGEKELLQTLAVIGSEFQLAIVRKTVRVSPDQLDHSLNRLQAREFIYERPAMGDVEYRFKHALTRDEAYNSLLTDRRKLLHERAARAIEASYRGRLEDHYDDLAHHYRLSDNAYKAVEYLRLASAQALKRSHHTEAIARARAALDLWPKIPSASDREDAEFSLQLTFGMASMPVLGLAAPEVGDAFERAAVLARQSRPGEPTFVVIGALWAFHFQRGDQRRANQLANEMLQIAATEKSEVLSIHAHSTFGASLFWLGRFAESLKHLRLASVARPGLSSLSVANDMADVPAFALACQASCLWQLGFPEQAATMCTRALARVDSLNHPFSAATVRLNVVEALLHIDPHLGQEEAEKIITISVEHGFPLTETIGKIFRNIAILDRGADRKVLTELAALNRRYADFGARLAFPNYGAALAKGYGEVGESDRGLKLVDKVLNFIEETSENLMKAELHRLRGQLLLLQTQSNSEEAERWFRTAVDLARDQQAKSWELRATTSLARLLAKHGKRDEARAMLAEIYNWFTEGFDTADLKDAKALLDQLSA
jgi:predicted ATPase